MKDELADILRAYLSGSKTMDDCYMWLSGVDWSGPGPAPEIRQILGSLELLAIEAYEGIRDESEFHEEVANFVAQATGSAAAPESRLAVASSTSSEGVAGN